MLDSLLDPMIHFASESVWMEEEREERARIFGGRNRESLFCVARTNFIQRAQDEHSHRTICGGCTICDRAARSNERGESLCVQTSRCSEQPQNPIGSVKAFGAFGSFGSFGAFGSFTAFDAFSAFGETAQRKLLAYL